MREALGWGTLFACVELLFGEASLVRFLRAFHKGVRFPRSGLVRRDELVKGNTFLRFTSLQGHPNSTVSRLSRSTPWLNLNSLEEDNQETESTARGYLASCGIADLPFAGAAPEVAELLLLDY